MGLWSSTLAKEQSETRNVNNNNNNENAIVQITKDQLPPEIDVSKIINEDKDAQELYCKCLKTHGYAILKFDEQYEQVKPISQHRANAAQIHENVNALFKDRVVYFQQDEETKMMNAHPSNPICDGI